MDSSKSSKTDTRIRPEIQTLRAIAIFSVLLFHLWEDKIKYGFLGVDIFFVISGYLMCSILTKKQPLNFGDILTFYERRFKRIIPLYLLVTSIVLFSLFYVVSEIQFHQIFKEAIKAITFTSNIPSNEQKDYFDTESRFYFFLHTWSLSVEIQFYLLVPFIFLILDFTNKYNCFKKIEVPTFLIVVGIFLSLTHQIFIKDPNAKYMSLFNRIWQFFFGFITFNIRNNYIIKDNKKANKKSSSKVRKVLYSLTLILLLFTLFYGFQFSSNENNRQINRFISVLLATYILTELNYLKIMKNKCFVILGDVSYSIYLIHWPLITCYRYINMGQDSSENIELSAGTALIILSILLGYVIEKSFKSFLKHINSWSLLIFVIFIGYSVNSILLFRLENNAVDMNKNLDEDPDLKEWREILKIPLNFKPNNTLKPLKGASMRQSLLDINSVLTRTGKEFSYCPNKNITLPTNHKINLTDFAPIDLCFEQGKGTKNIVIIGNSHSNFNYIGIAHVFRSVYKNLYVFSRRGCMPVSEKFQSKVRGGKEHKLCAKLINDYIPTLEKWKEPIDIIITLFGFVSVPEFPIIGNIKNDQLLNEMEDFYRNLSKIAKDVLIVQGAIPIFNEDIFALFRRKNRGNNGEPLKIGQTRKSMLLKEPLGRKRIEALDCGPKCLKMNWLDFWCGKNEDGYCNAIDPSGLLYFADSSHPSPLGTIKQTEVMLKEYERFMVNKV